MSLLTIPPPLPSVLPFWTVTPEMATGPPVISKTRDVAPADEVAAWMMVSPDPAPLRARLVPIVSSMPRVRVYVPIGIFMVSPELAAAIASLNEQSASHTPSSVSAVLVTSRDAPWTAPAQAQRVARKIGSSNTDKIIDVFVTADIKGPPQVGVGNQQKWDTFVKERSGGNGSVVGLPEQVVVAFAAG